VENFAAQDVITNYFEPYQHNKRHYGRRNPESGGNCSDVRVVLRCGKIVLYKIENEELINISITPSKERRGASPQQFFYV
jgi:hypothetical protein